MLRLSIPDMSCGHCVATVTKTVKSIDDAAIVDIDLSSQIVAVDTKVDLARIRAALEQAGYPATPTGPGLAGS